MHAYILVYNAATAKIIAVKNFEVGAVIHFTYTATTPSELRLDLVSDQGDHLFLFKIQYNEYKKIVLNSFLDNAWGAEESPAGFPFDATTVFVAVVVEKSGYRITVNGGAFQYLYKHRRSPSLVTSINSNIEQISYGAVS